MTAAPGASIARITQHHPRNTMNPDQLPPAPTADPVSTPPVASAVTPPWVAAAPEPTIVTMSSPRRGHGKTVLAVCAVLVLAALGAGYALAYRGAEAVLPGAARELAETSSVHTSAEIEVDVEAAGERFNLSMQVEGDLDQSDREHPKSQVTFDAEFDGMLMGGEARLVDGNVYFKATKIPGAALAGSPEIQALVGQWFSVSPEEIGAATLEPLDLSGDAAESGENFARLLDSGAVSFGAPTIKKFEGEYVREYAVTMDSGKLSDFIVAEARRLATTSEMTALVDQFSPALEAIVPAISLDGGLVRVSVFSGELRAVAGTVTVDGAKIDQAALAAASGDEPAAEAIEGKVTIDFSATYSGYGERVVVEEPVGASSIMSLFGQETLMYDADIDAYYAEGDPHFSADGYDRGAAESVADFSGN